MKVNCPATQLGSKPVGLVAVVVADVVVESLEGVIPATASINNVSCQQCLRLQSLDVGSRQGVSVQMVAGVLTLLPIVSWIVGAPGPTSGTEWAPGSAVVAVADPSHDSGGDVPFLNHQLSDLRLNTISILRADFQQVMK